MEWGKESQRYEDKHTGWVFLAESERHNVSKSRLNVGHLLCPLHVQPVVAVRGTPQREGWGSACFPLGLGNSLSSRGQTQKQNPKAHQENRKEDTNGVLGRPGEGPTLQTSKPKVVPIMNDVPLMLQKECWGYLGSSHFILSDLFWLPHPNFILLIKRSYSSVYTPKGG